MQLQCRGEVRGRAAKLDPGGTEDLGRFDGTRPGESGVMDSSIFQNRLSFHDAIETMEVDFSDFVFADAAMVDAFYDHIDRRVGATGRRWYFLVLYEGC